MQKARDLEEYPYSEFPRAYKYKIPDLKPDKKLAAPCITLLPTNRKTANS